MIHHAVSLYSICSRIICSNLARFPPPEPPYPSVLSHIIQRDALGGSIEFRTAGFFFLAQGHVCLCREEKPILILFSKGKVIAGPYSPLGEADT